MITGVCLDQVFAESGNIQRDARYDRLLGDVFEKILADQTKICHSPAVGSFKYRVSLRRTISVLIL